MAGTDDPTSDRHQHEHPLAAPAPASTPTPRRLPLAAAAILVGLSVNLALCLRRARDDPGAAAFVLFSHLNLFALLAALRRLEHTPHGSPAQARARLAVWLMTTTLSAAFTWRIGPILPLGLAVAAWVLAAATVLGGFYMMLLYGGDDK